MSTIKTQSAEDLMKDLQQRIKTRWKKEMKIELSANRDSVIVSAKSFDMDADDLHDLANMIGDWKINFGRSGANFRMIIW